MNGLQIADDLDELRSVAKKMDEGLRFLEKKLSNSGSLGLSIDPQKTKITAENLIKEYEEEIEAVKCNVEECLDIEKRVLEDTIENNEKISNFLEQMRDELREVELLLLSKGNYQLFESNEEKENSVIKKNTEENVSRCDQSSFDENINNTQETTNTNSSRNKKFISVHNWNTSVERYMSPITSCDRKEMTRINLSHRSEADVDKYIGESCLNTSKSLPKKKLNFNDDVIRTPVDPGISAVTRQLLGKSNIKCKMAKENSLSRFNEINY